MTVRVVAGTARGRRLATLEGSSTRPTSDRVREATFNALVSLGGVARSTVLDLFAGSGALAIEALSRGAEKATLVEHDGRACAIVKQNLTDVGFAEQAEVVAGDAMHFLRNSSSLFDLVLLDPPYQFADWSGLLAELLPKLRPDALVVTESDRPLGESPGLAVVRERRYGGTVVSFRQPAENATTKAGASE